MRKTAISLFPLAALLAACASGPTFKEMQASMGTIAADKGRIYFYRTTMMGAAVQPEILLNGLVVGKATPGGFFFVDQPPGQCEVSIQAEAENRLAFALDAGHKRYVRFDMQMGLLAGRVVPRLIDEPQGVQEIEETKFAGTVTPAPALAAVPAASNAPIRMASAASSPTVGTNRAASRAGLPVVGDSWVYRLRQPKALAGPMERALTVTVTSVSDSEIVDQMNTGDGVVNQRHPTGGYLITQGAALFAPYLAAYGPISASTLAEIKTLDRSSCDGAYTCVSRGRVVGRERITVAAGTFDAMKVIIEQRWTPFSGPTIGSGAADMAGGRTLTVWYAADLKRAVKYASRLEAGRSPAVESDFELELVSYQLN